MKEHRWPVGNRLALTLHGTLEPRDGVLISVYEHAQGEARGWLVRARGSLGPVIGHPRWAAALIAEHTAPDEATAWALARELAAEAMTIGDAPPAARPVARTGVLS